MLSINIWQYRWNVWQPVVPVVPRNRTRIVALTFSNFVPWRSTLLFVRGFYYSTAMRSGNDQFPHGGISIMASSVTRFDTLQINSPADSACGARERRRGGGEKRGNRIRSFLVPSISHREFLLPLWYVQRMLVKARMVRCANRAVRIFHAWSRLSIDQIRRRSRKRRVQRWPSWFRVVAIESRNPFVISCVRGPETRSFASERRRVFFLRKGCDPRCDEFYVSLRKRVLIDDFFHRRIYENRETIGCSIDDLSRCFSSSGKWKKVQNSNKISQEIEYTYNLIALSQF